MTASSNRSATETSLTCNEARELTGKVALVTGAGRGIGRAIADRLARAGATTIYGYRADPATALAAVERTRASGGDAFAEEVDVANPAQVEDVVSRIAETHGGIDILVNNAGVLARNAFLEIPLAEWEQVLRTNLTGSFVVSQAVARVMAGRGRGAIVHISSTNDGMASARCTAYAASKAGVGMLTRQMALELGPLGIRTNAVAPGMVETDLNRHELADTEFHNDAMRRIPIGRFATADDVAEAVRFLAGDAASAVNGVTLLVDGGRRAA